MSNTSDRTMDDQVEDAFGAPDEEKDSLGKRLKSGFPKDYRKNVSWGGLILVLATAGFIGISMLSGGPSDSVDANVEASPTSVTEIPNPSITDTKLYGVDSYDSAAAERASQEALDAAKSSGQSKIESIDFFEKATADQALIDDQAFDAEVDEPVERGVADGMQRTGKLRNYDPNANRTDYAPSFAKLLEENRIDVESWHDDIGRMTADSDTYEYGGDSASGKKNYPGDDTEFSNSRSSNNFSAYDEDPGSATDSSVQGADNDNYIPTGDYYTAVPTEIVWLELKGDLDTDEPGTIAEIISGPLKGARLMGAASVTVSKRIAIVYNQMIFRDQIIPVRLVVLEPNSLRHSVEGRVDSHYFSRYFPFVLAKFSSAYAESLMSSITVINTDGTQTTQNNPLPDTNQQLKFAAGSALEGLLPTWEERLNRKPTGFLKRGTVLMAMFTSPVAID